MAAAIAALLLGLFAAAPSFAGGGPENVLLVVNVNSDSSKTVANHYIALRHIPPNNVLNLDWKGGLEICSAKVFLEQALRPIHLAIANRGLTAQIDYIVYSSDFPWRVELKPLFPDQKFDENFSPTGSLTGVTYLGQYLLDEKPNPAIVMPHTNWYVPEPDAKNLFQCQQLVDVKTHGFRSRYSWNPVGEVSQADGEGQKYYLSTCLGVTRGRANNVDEVVAYLKRAKSADGTRPRGTIYFMHNNDVRSRTRDACFAGVAAAIEQAGVRARVLEGRIPSGAKDVAGMVVGAETFDVAAAGNTILPGAICEHLTSAGGILSTSGYQTPLTDFLRQGAAGASGTIIEPRALQAKFPLPSLQLHYVRGCSLAEAFYQSVAGPYQLLVVGDPLCQPWATPPTITVKGITTNQEVSGTVKLDPAAKSAAGRQVGSYEMFVDSRLLGSTADGKELTLDTTKLLDGYHELWIVGTQTDSIETQGQLIVPFTVKNREAALEFSILPQKEVPAAGAIKVEAKQTGAKRIVIRQNSRVVGRVEGATGSVEIQATLLGRGPTTLQAVSEGPAPAISKPIPINIR